jgi:predicted protein tyrosine phosphatase
MMTNNVPILTVCGLDELEIHSGGGVTHVLSLLDPQWPEPPQFANFGSHKRATFYFHDAIEPGPRLVLPQRSDVEAILAFGRDLGDDLRHLLVHCHAGISRSTASMTMIMAQASPRQDESAIIDELARIRPQAWPNSRMIGFADDLLGRRGRLTDAVEALYARRLAERPELAEIMRRLERGREVDVGLRLKG